MVSNNEELHLLEPPPALLDSGVTEDLTKLVSFMREDNDHVVFRRFDRLHLYNLLYIQHRLTDLDKKVAQLEENRDIHGLASVLPTLEPLIKSYNEALLAQDQLGRLPATPSHLASNLKAFSVQGLIELKNELDPERGWSELVSVASTQKGWIHTFIDKHYRLQRLFKKHGSNHCNSPILIYSEENVRRAEQTLVNLAFCILVICPIFALSYLTNKVAKLFLVLGCVLITSVLASVLSNSAQKSSLAVMAGYTAILVVFLSNNVGTT